MNEPAPEQHDSHGLNARGAVLVWLGLLALTAFTVLSSYADLKHVTLLAVLIVATTKAGLVLFYFMHVRWDSLLIRVMILAALLTYAVFAGLTFLDYGYR